MRYTTKLAVCPTYQQGYSDSYLISLASDWSFDLEVVSQTSRADEVWKQWMHLLWSGLWSVFATSRKWRIHVLLGGLWSLLTKARKHWIHVLWSRLWPVFTAARERRIHVLLGVLWSVLAMTRKHRIHVLRNGSRSVFTMAWIQRIHVLRNGSWSVFNTAWKHGRSYAWHACSSELFKGLLVVKHFKVHRPRRLARCNIWLWHSVNFSSAISVISVTVNATWCRNIATNWKWRPSNLAACNSHTSTNASIK